MKRILLNGVLLIVTIVFLSPCFAAAKPAGKPAVPLSGPPTRTQILALADSYIAKIVPRLTGENSRAISFLEFDLKTAKNYPVFMKPLISDRVSQFTVALAEQKSIPALIAGSAYLVHYDPTNPRTTNLLASAVAANKQRKDAITLFEYTWRLDMKSTLAMLNLASIYMDDGQYEKAKTLIDKVLVQEQKNQRAYRLLACYWYKKGNNQKTIEALMKAAAQNGVRIKKRKENRQKTDENESKTDDRIEVLEQKATAMQDLVPLSTADLIEESYPDLAQQIRDRVGKLMDNEKMGLPRLPDVNTLNLRAYHCNAPVLSAWMQAVELRAADALKEIALQRVPGLKETDSEEVAERKAAAAAQQQLAQQLNDAQRMLQVLKNTPGVSKADIAQAEKQVRQAAAQHGVTLQKNAGTNAQGHPDLSGIIDTGGLFAERNYHDYIVVRNTYEIYFMKYIKRYNEQLLSMFHAYDTQTNDETTYHDNLVKQIDDDEQREVEAADRANRFPDTDRFTLKRKKEQLRHALKMNEIGDDFYKQWVNLYMPQYAQKMKPMLERYWKVTALYVRNMNDPKVMEREYLHIKGIYWTYASMAAGYMSGGEHFKYTAESEEEVEQLRAEIAAAEELAEQKKQEYAQQVKVADNSMPKWLADKLVLSVACEFLAIKITPRNIEFEAYIPGLSGKVDYNFQSNTVTTSTALTARVNFGIQLGPLEAKLEGEAKLLGSSTKFDFNNGKVTEESDGFAEGTIKAVFGKAESEHNGWTVGGDPDTGGISSRVGARIQIDPARDTEVMGQLFASSVGMQATKDFE